MLVHLNIKCAHIVLFFWHFLVIFFLLFSFQNVIFSISFHFCMYACVCLFFFLHFLIYVISNLAINCVSIIIISFCCNSLKENLSVCIDFYCSLNLSALTPATVAVRITFDAYASAAALDACRCDTDDDDLTPLLNACFPFRAFGDKYVM